jgi:hypothetical protein
MERGILERKNRMIAAADMHAKLVANIVGMLNHVSQILSAHKASANAESLETDKALVAEYLGEIWGLVGLHKLAASKPGAASAENLQQLEALFADVQEQKNALADKAARRQKLRQAAKTRALAELCALYGVKDAKVGVSEIVQKIASDVEVLAEYEALLSDIQEAKNVLVERDNQRVKARRGAQEHAKLFPECIRLREELEPLITQIEKADLARHAAYQNHQFALGQAGEHIRNPLRLDDYPSAKQREQWEAQKNRLLDRVEEKRQELLCAKARADELRGKYFELRNKFQTAAWKERMLRPPDAPSAKSWVVGSLGN